LGFGEGVIMRDRIKNKDIGDSNERVEAGRNTCD